MGEVVFFNNQTRKVLKKKKDNFLNKKFYTKPRKEARAPETALAV
jgi:hypothetical protein